MTNIIRRKETWDSETDLVAVAEVSHHEKCIKQSVLTVVRIVKYLSNQQKENQFIAENVTLKDQNQTDFS
jgi:hypothetical protein